MTVGWLVGIVLTGFMNHTRGMQNGTKIYDIYEKRPACEWKRKWPILGKGKLGVLLQESVCFFFCWKMTQQLRNVQSERIFCWIIASSSFSACKNVYRNFLFHMTLVHLIKKCNVNTKNTTSSSDPSQFSIKQVEHYSTRAVCSRRSDKYSH